MQWNRDQKSLPKPAFCLETSLWALNLSNLAYWDPPAEFRTAAEPTKSTSGDMSADDLDALALNGFAVLGFVSDNESDTHATIFGDGTTLWVAFRGTASHRMVETDVDTIQVPLVLRTASDPDIQWNNNSSSFLPNRIAREATQRMNNPVISSMLNRNFVASVHRGFWRAYHSVQAALHAAIRKQLESHMLGANGRLSEVVACDDPAQGGFSFGGSFHGAIVFTGHSLGGALASIASLDFAYLTTEGKVLDCPFDGPTESAFNEIQRGPTGPRPKKALSDVFEGDEEFEDPEDQGKSRSRISFRDLSSSSSEHDRNSPAAPISSGKGRSYPAYSDFDWCQVKLLLECYSLGSPRVGDNMWAKNVKRLVPSTFRIVYEGDVVTGMPRAHCGAFQVFEMCTPMLLCGNVCGLAEYKHTGTSVYLSRKGRGDILISPSPAERLVYLWWSRSITGHFVTSYMHGLLQAAEHVPDLLGSNVDMKPHMTSPGHTRTALDDNEGVQSRRLMLDSGNAGVAEAAFIHRAPPAHRPTRAGSIEATGQGRGKDEEEGLAAADGGETRPAPASLTEDSSGEIVVNQDSPALDM